MTGEWIATDTSQRVMALSLTQAGDSVKGSGTVNTEQLTASGVNVTLPQCCHDEPCALEFPVSLTIVDAAGNHLIVWGGLNGTDASHFNVEIFDESPNFPFYFVTEPAVQLTLNRVVVDPLQRTALVALRGH